MARPSSELQQLLAEILRRQANAAKEHGSRLGNAVGDYSGKGEIFLQHLHDKQKEWVQDTSQRKVAVCSRRAGKTVGVVAGMCRASLNHSDSVQAYVAPTRGQAKQIVWREFKRLDRHYKVGMRFVETELYIEFPNRSIIFLAGADKKPDIDRLRGLALLKVVLDEAQSFRAHIRELIDSVLGPALEDYVGSVELTGTPGKALAGMYYEVSEGSQAANWSQHRWTCHEHNSKFPRWAGQSNWREQARLWIESIKKLNNFTESSPTFIREYLGKWFRDLSSLVYRFTEDNYYETAPVPPSAWVRILGVDLGHSTFTAFTVGQYHPNLPNVWYPYSYKKSKMNVSDVAEKIRALQKQWGIHKTVADAGGLGKMMIEEFRIRHGLSVVPAQKTDKLGAIETFNDDLQAKRILIPRGSPLATEWSTLQKTAEGTEDPRQQNHCADTALYIHRECRHYRHSPFLEDPKPGTQAFIDKEMAEYEQELERRLSTPSEDVDDMWDRYGIGGDGF